MNWRRIMAIGADIAVFWVWNLLFLFWSLMIVPELFRFRELPWDIVGAMLGIVSVPVWSLVFGIFKIRETGWHLRFFYGVEAPLMLFVVMRLVLIREMSLGLGVMLGVFIGGSVLYGLQLSKGLFERSWLAIGQLILGAVLLVDVAWMGSILGIWLTPYGVDALRGVLNLLRELMRFEWLENFRARDLWLVPNLLVLIPLLLWSGSLLFAVPLLYAPLHFFGWLRLAKQGAARFGKGPVAALSGGGLVAVGGLLSQVGSVDPTPSLDMLKEPPQTEETRQLLLKQQSQLQTVLVDAALSPYRYWGTTDNANNISMAWKHTFNIEATGLQTVFNFLVSPLIYPGGVMWEDQAAAKQAYLHLMDAPFEKAERESILNAVQATWDSDEAKAGLVNIGQKIVHLESQRVELKVQGPLVFGQLDEVYRNTTDSDQEILIYFTLPESAALTALYLSEDPNDPEQFPYVLAPRGAAQEVYNNQVRRFRDPALLEQVGPRQYRLRAYPVLADFRDKPMYLRMRWTALADAQGLPLPFATEVRNLYWNSRTDREFLCIQDEEYACDDGRAIADPRPMDVEVAGWLPARLGRPVPPQTLVASLPGGQKLVARADSGEDGSCEGEKVAVVVDGSFSMGANLEQLQKEFTWMREGLSRCTTRLVVAPGWGGARVKEDTLAWDPASYTFFGNLRPQEALEGLRDQAFDRVLFLTDAGSYDDPADTAVPDFTGQLWLIHLGGALPQAYPDVIGDRLLSGGIAMSVKEAVARWGAEEVADGYRWQLEESTAGDTPGFLALAGRRALTIQARENLPDTLEEFDAVHKVALSAGAVTPWSSMLVLVDDEQRRQLKEAEEKADRFNRESEGGAELMTQPGNPLVSAVPEPATWMLLGCAGAGILGLRKRAAKTQRAQRGESRGERGLPEKVAREAGEL